MKTNWLFWIGIVFTLTAPIVIGTVYGDPSTSWVAALCGAFVIFMSKLESLAELSLGPVKARMREALEEAAATIAQLRHVATASSEATLTDLMSGGFMGGMTLEKRLELHDKVVSALREIGATEQDIARAKSDWNKGIAIIYHRAIIRHVEERKTLNQINPDASEAQKAAGNELQELHDFNTWSVPTPHQIRAVLKRRQIDSENVDQWVDDYEHFLETGEIRRREAFVRE